MQTAVKIASLERAYALIEGYGVVFGGADLHGERFTDQTDFGEAVRWLAGVEQPGAGGQLPVYYDHSQTAELPLPIGRVTGVRRDARGLWMWAQLERHQAYVEEVLELIARGALGWSSGSAAHLVRRAGRVIMRWPLVEMSLTPAPAEPRCLGVERTKRWYAGWPQSMTKGVTVMETTETTETTLMDQAPTVDGQVQAVAGLAERLGRLEEQMHGLLSAPDVKGGYMLPGDVALDQGYRAERALKAFRHYVRTGAKAALQQDTDTEGGYLVPTTYSSELARGLHDLSILRQAGARVLQAGGTDSFRVPTLGYSGAAVLTAEEAAFDEQAPTFSEIDFRPYKYTRLCKVSDELVESSRFDVMRQVLLPDALQAFATAENRAFTIGTGTNEPQGVVAGASLGHTAANATKIVADDILQLFYSLSYLYRQRAVWLMEDATMQAIRLLKTGDGQYLWQPGLHASEPDTLLGRPVYTLNAMASIATGERVVVFGDLAYFWIVDFGALSLRRLEELYAATGQVGFRFYKRVDSHVVLSEALKYLAMA